MNMSDLISMLEATQIMIGDRHYTRLRSVFGRMKDAPKPVKRGPGKKNWYDRREIIEYAENHDVIRLMNNAFTELRNERSQQSRERERITPVPLNSLHIQFLRGDFDPEYRRMVRRHVLRLARERAPETVRISIGDRAA
jgi:hypothetical protein